MGWGSTGKGHTWRWGFYSIGIKKPRKVLKDKLGNVGEENCFCYTYLRLIV